MDVLFHDLHSNIDKPMELFVFSSNTNQVRIVIVMPTTEWGNSGSGDSNSGSGNTSNNNDTGNGILGATIAHGYLHHLPSKLITTKPALSGSHLVSDDDSTSTTTTTSSSSTTLEPSQASFIIVESVTPIITPATTTTTTTTSTTATTTSSVDTTAAAIIKKDIQSPFGSHEKLSGTEPPVICTTIPGSDTTATTST